MRLVWFHFYSYTLCSVSLFHLPLFLVPVHGVHHYSHFCPWEQRVTEEISSVVNGLYVVVWELSSGERIQWERKLRLQRGNILRGRLEEQVRGEEVWPSSLGELNHDIHYVWSISCLSHSVFFCSYMRSSIVSVSPFIFLCFLACNEGCIYYFWRGFFIMIWGIVEFCIGWLGLFPLRLFYGFFGKWVLLTENHSSWVFEGEWSSLS